MEGAGDSGESGEVSDDRRLSGGGVCITDFAIGCESFFGSTASGEDACALSIARDSFILAASFRSATPTAKGVEPCSSAVDWHGESRGGKGGGLWLASVSGFPGEPFSDLPAASSPWWGYGVGVFDPELQGSGVTEGGGVSLTFLSMPFSSSSC